MTTTAHEDQFTVGTQTIERIREPYNTVAILRRNVADLELALRTQTERAEAAEAELARLREQKPFCFATPVAEMGHDWTRAVFFSERNKEWKATVPLYAAPVPAHVAAPTVVFVAHNKTCSVIFADRNAADQFASSCGPAAAGVAITECAVIGSQSAPQAPAVPEQKPIWSGWSVWFKGGDGLFPAHFLHDSYGIPLRYPTRFDAAEKIKRHTRDSRELYEPREYSLYDAPQAPAVPSGCVAYLAQLADDPCQCHCCRTKRRKASALLQSAEVTK